MKIFQKFGFALAFILTFAVLATAQTEKEKSDKTGKIAVFYAEDFEDKEKGIKELVDAYKILDDEFKPVNDELKLLVGKYNELTKELIEIGKCSRTGCPYHITKEPIGDKIKELESLESEIRKKQEEGKRLYEKRRAEVLGAVWNKIIKALEEFAEEKGFVMILEGKNFCNSCFNMCKDEDNITGEFIEYYNSLSAKQQ